MKRADFISLPNEEDIRFRICGFSFRFRSIRNQVDVRCLLLFQVHLDHKHMGLGGDDSWTPCVHDKYLVRAAPYSFSIRFSPITAATSGHEIYKSQLQK